MANARTFEDAVHTSLPGSPTPLSNNFGSPDGSAPDIERTGSRSSTRAENQRKSPYSLRKMPLFLQSVSRVENWVHTLSQSMATVTTIEQVVGGLAARVWKQVQPLPQTFPAGQDLGPHWSKLTAPQLQGPMVSRRRLETFSKPDNENARSAVL